jgi:hypothetical protein
MDLSKDFFYNLIPGFVFLICLLYLLGYRGGDFNNPVLATAIIIGFGTFIGFFFQALTTLCRRYLGINEYSMLMVKKKNKQAYDEAIIKLNKAKLLNNKCDKIDQEFHIMHNYLWSRKLDDPAVFFGARLALWANTFWASVLLLGVALYQHNVIIGTFSIIILPLTLWQSVLNLEILYEVILTTFASQNIKF